MSYVETPANYRFSWYVRLLLWLQRRRYGRALEPVRLWGRIPGALLAVLAMNRVLDRKRSRIEPALRSLIQVRISQINWCTFCVDLNSHLGRERGISEEKLSALHGFAESPVFSERERAALRYAEAVTRGDVRVDAQTVSRLREHFDDDAIVELAALIAFQNLSSKFNAALGTPAHGFCTPGGAER
jgi:AhpD family alkylhydroperoxidase